MSNGVSKKLCIVAISISAITKLAEGATVKWPYAVAIAGICVIYKLVQGFIDWKTNG